MSNRTSPSRGDTVITLNDLETFVDNLYIGPEKIDSKQAQEGKVLVSDGNGGAKFATPISSAVNYLTKAPKADNDSGTLIFVVLESAPSRFYNGYYYVILESEEEEENEPDQPIEAL